eukprot:TRINITY_DN1202_c0_g1_i1.p1 TRINITY_DN1202_c0_g1~~TRINITY_DN1202_c0_g1_i1.p1  ORF type:complete len:1246 (-),score=287.08 TRINITY_DN1202_c0_g1_i1:71-3808(-)
MLAKLETKSNRVKGVSFHPTRPWVLASLHNGVIQLYDYRIRTLLDKFEEHDGPVRGLHFHPTQPLFVSGGDDYKIKVWNYRQRRCLYPLLGHLDYIRTVQFHHEYPWILSSSDDQTIRIWNWQSKTCVAVLTGHNHYVMCASFHPSEDLVVSASLDQTIRVWDISALRKKNVSGPGTSSSTPYDDSSKLSQNDLFGNTDAMVKYVLEGHERGVNWVSFHPTAPLIVSGADDRQIKLWRMNESRAWEVDSFRGHFNNVSCVLFHPKQDIIISNSEDKTIRVWDVSKRSGIKTFRREHDRFWILAAHPENNLFAAGHDAGMIVFKLERERPAYASVGNDSLLFVKERSVLEFNYNNSKSSTLFTFKTLKARIKSMEYSSENRAALLYSDLDGGTYELYQIPKDKNENLEPKRGSAISVVFLGMKRFAVLEKSNTISVRDFMNEEVKKITPGGTVDRVYPAPSGFLILQSEDNLSLYDLQAKKSVAEMTAAEVKYVFWSRDRNPLVALISEDTLIIANRKFEQLCTVHESVRIKSGTWDDSGVFIYSTSNHIKYCLSNGDNGIIRTLDNPLYITGMKDNKVFCLDREGKTRTIMVDTTEFVFKNALVQRQYSAVLRMVKEYNMIGQAIISYLQKKGFPEVALYFVKDERTRFNLALESGNIEIALESAKILDDKDSWNKIGAEALRQGNHQIVEMAYQRTKNFEKLSFLYLITGNIEKLKKMMKIAREMRNDAMSRFHNALYLGDIKERVKLLEEVGQLSLAYASANLHNLKTEEETIKAKWSAIHPDGQLPNINSKEARLMFPPLPVSKSFENNWPLLNVTKGYFDGPAPASSSTNDQEKRLERNTGAISFSKDDLGEANWDEELIVDDDVEEKEEEKEKGEGKSEWDIDEIDISDDDVAVSSSGSKSSIGSFAVLPNPGPSARQNWLNNSELAADHVAAGSFETAMKLLNEQIGIVNFAPLKSSFLQIAKSCYASVPTMASLPSYNVPLNRSEDPSLPLLSISFQPLIDVKLKAAIRLTFQGRIPDALQQFTQIIQSIPLVVANNKKEANDAKELILMCREYILATRMEIMKRELGADDLVRQTELAAYFTHCKIEEDVLKLGLRSAMTLSYKIKNVLHAASFARRLLELNPPEDVAATAKKIIKLSEKEGSNTQTIRYNDRNPFVVCASTFVPIYKGTPHVNCPFCTSSFVESCSGQVCPTCKLAQIGGNATGIILLPPTKDTRQKKQKKVVKKEESESESDSEW